MNYEILLIEMKHKLPPSKGRKSTAFEDRTKVTGKGGMTLQNTNNLIVHLPLSLLTSTGSV
jgi:hypothetical protein